MKKHLKLCTALIVVAAMVMSLLFFLLYWFFGDKYENLDDYFSEEFAIPGLDNGFIPQGLGSYTDETSSSVSDTVFLVSGYMNKGGASRIYVVENDEETNQHTTTGYVTVMLDDDTVYEGHGSGVATNGSYVWLCSESTVYILDYDEVLEAAKDNQAVTIVSSFDACCNASFCYYGALGSSTTKYLFVGEFYRSGNYETDEGHHVTTSAGDENKAIILRFSASSTSPSPLSIGYSITGLIQGMATTHDGSYITLSQSYGLSDSHILTYKYTSSNTTTITYTKSDGTTKDITAYVFDSSNLVNDYEIPSMSEGLCTINNRVYVLFESAGDKYKMFVRERLYNVYSVKLNEKKFSV